MLIDFKQGRDSFVENQRKELASRNDESYITTDMNSHHKPQRHYFLLYKPFGVLSQFTAEGDKKTLHEFGPFPSDVYPAGRLDFDSEGLLLLTNDGTVKHRLMDPKFQHERVYLVQVERIPDDEALTRLRSGVVIEGKKTRSAGVRRLEREPALPPRPVQIRFRKTVPTCWLEMTLHEGRNRQVRKMTAAVGHPALRLVRIRIGRFSLEGLQLGESRKLNEQEATQLREDLGLTSDYS